MPSEDLAVTREELLERANALRRRTAAGGLDALLLTTGDNLRYVSGYASPARSGARPFIFILPLHGEPVFIVHTGREREARAFSWAGDVRTYYPLSHAPVELMADALRERGLASGIIGIESGEEQCLDMPLVDLYALQAALPRATWVDGGTVLWAARRVKTAQEVARLRRACAITGQACARVFPELRARMPEREVARRFRDAMLDLGADDTWLLLTAGPGYYDMVSRGPLPRSLERGDLLYVDGGACVEGYWCDFDRSGVVGGATPEQQAAQRAAQEVTALGVSMVGPGADTRDIARACAAALARFPFAITSDIGGLAARIGHGIGLAPVEPPNVAGYESTILEPGMVITVEPGVDTEFGVFHIEQDVLITESGHEVLSMVPSDIWEIPG